VSAGGSCAGSSGAAVDQAAVALVRELEGRAPARGTDLIAEAGADADAERDLGQRLGDEPDADLRRRRAGGARDVVAEDPDELAGQLDLVGDAP